MEMGVGERDRPTQKETWKWDDTTESEKNVNEAREKQRETDTNRKTES